MLYYLSSLCIYDGGKATILIGGIATIPMVGKSPTGWCLLTQPAGAFCPTGGGFHSGAEAVQLFRASIFKQTQMRLRYALENHPASFNQTLGPQYCQCPLIAVQRQPALKHPLLARFRNPESTMPLD